MKVKAIVVALGLVASVTAHAASTTDASAQQQQQTASTANSTNAGNASSFCAHARRATARTASSTIREKSFIGKNCAFADAIAKLRVLTASVAFSMHRRGSSEGTPENSPAFQRRVNTTRAARPGGTVERRCYRVLSRPSGT